MILEDIYNFSFSTRIDVLGSYIHITLEGIANENSQADINAQFASTSGKLIVEYGLSSNDINDQYSYGNFVHCCPRCR